MAETFMATGQGGGHAADCASEIFERSDDPRRAVECEVNQLFAFRRSVSRRSQVAAVHGADCLTQSPLSALVRGSSVSYATSR
jgi:hypothetical protein